jgi:hypothetical protein
VRLANDGIKRRRAHTLGKGRVGMKVRGHRTLYYEIKQRAIILTAGLEQHFYK